jgi:hypothetical protein
MRLGNVGEPGQATLADLACVHAFAGKFDEALAELEDVEPWNLSLRSIFLPDIGGRKWHRHGSDRHYPPCWKY